MGKTLKIWNEFGETPKVSFTAAGQDFFVPRLNGKTDKQKEAAFNAFLKSFGINSYQLQKMIEKMESCLMEKIGDKVRAVNNTLDAVHLFLALDSVANRNKHSTTSEKIEDFVEHRLEYDKSADRVGLWMDMGDQLKINSGIHEVLPTDYAGVFLNKSGKGNQGFDVRSQVVDEDYSGIVHLSIAFTKDGMKSPTVWCGDKITQQLIVPVWQVSQMDEISEDEYRELMKNSSRGDNGFGSQDDIK